jgi:hypothetical protein
MTTTVWYLFLSGMDKTQLTVGRIAMKYSTMDWGTMEAVVNKLGGIDGVQRLLRGETTVSEPARRWREQDGVIYFSVTSDGTTGEQWIERLEKKGFRIGDYAKSVLRSPNFKPTSGIATEVAVLKGELFSDNNRITKKIRADADNRKFTKPNAEVSCLIRENFSDKEIEELGLIWIVTMHKPINDFDGDSCLLSAYRSGDGRGLGADYGRPDDRWGRGGGFAFAVSQVSS